MTSGFKPITFGKYELTDMIGSGGMAEVFLARSFGAEGLEKTLVIKRILPAFAKKERFQAMFIDEAKIAVSLNHPNIVQTYDFGRVGEDYFLAMEYVEGTDLGELLQRIRSVGTLPLGEALFLGIEICKGLDYAHRRTDQYGEPLRLVHRDISPQNLIISKDGNLKIVDFGIAHTRTISSEAQGSIKGKYSYMSPEQAGGLPVDGRSDLFSAAAVLFEMLYGKPLFRFTTSEETLALVRNAILPDLHALNPNFPDALEKTLYRALSRDPAQRHESARELQVDLHRILMATGDIHDAQTVAATIAEIEMKTEDERAKTRAQTVLHGPEARTPPIVGTLASTSVTGADLTPATPAIQADVSVPGEIRRTKKDFVCVSGHITGFTELRAASQDGKWQSLLLELMRIIEAIAFKNRAIVERFSETSFLILLGLPASSENDAERAVWMALDLLEAVAGINLNLDTPIHVSIGMALGRAHISQPAGNRVYERQILGQVTELSHRMATEAMPREILVGGKIYQRIRRTFDLAFLKQIPFEEDERYGWSNPSVYRLLRPKTRKERQAELRKSYNVLHGRELPLKALRERFHKVQVDRRCLGIAIKGATGLGKSSIVEEFLRGVESQTVVPEARWGDAVGVLRSLATHHSNDTPYATVRELLADALDIEVEHDIRTIKHRIEEIVDEFFQNVEDEEKLYLLHTLGFFFDVKYSPSSLEVLSSQHRRSRIFLSLTRLFERLALNKPLIVVVEDLHYCDSSSVDFLADFLGNAPPRPILLLLTTRPMADTHANHERLLYSSNVVIEQLTELSRRHAAIIIRERLGDFEVDKVAMDYILDRSGGVPYFIREMVDALRARKVLKLVNERYTLGGSANETWLPASLEAVIAARIDELEPQLKEALQHCSILGIEFEERDATFVFGEEIGPKLKRLVQLEWLLLSKAGYRFEHTLVYEVAFRELLWEERQDVHDRLADHLIAEVKAGHRHANLANIARHLEGATRTAEAADFYFLAADDAMKNSSHTEALRMINRALKFACGDAYYRALDVKEHILAVLSHHEERYATLLEMRRIGINEDFEEVAQLRVLNRLARYWYEQRNFEEAMPLVEEVLVRAEHAGEYGELARAKTWAATMMRETGSAEAAIELLGEALLEFNTVDDHESAAWALKAMADTFWQMGRYDDALEVYQDALDNFEIQDKDLREVIAVNMGLVHVSRGEYELGLERYMEALRSCRSIGYQRREAGILPNLGHLYLLIGEPKRAERILRRGVRLAKQVRDNLVLADALLTLGVVFLEQGRFPKAESTLRKGQRLAVTTEVNYLRIHAHIAIARLLLLQKSEDALNQTLENATEAIRLGKVASMAHGVVHGHHLVSLAHERLGNNEHALASGAQALQEIEQHAVVDFVTVLVEQGELIERLQPERTQEAHALYRRAGAVVEHVAALFGDPRKRERYLARPSIARVLQAAEQANTQR